MYTSQANYLKMLICSAANDLRMRIRSTQCDNSVVSRLQTSSTSADKKSDRRIPLPSLSRNFFASH